MISLSVMPQIYGMPNNPSIGAPKQSYVALPNMTLSERMKAALAEMPRGSQVALARHCGVKPPSVTDWINGRTAKIEGANLVKAAEFLRVRVRWLADGRGPMREGLSEAKAEQQPASYFPDWPFSSVTPAEWRSIPPKTREMLELQIKALLPDTGGEEDASRAAA